MQDEKYPREDYSAEDKIDWEIMEEESIQLPGQKKRKLVLRVTACVILLAFLAFSYVQIPWYWLPRLDFLEQNPTLSSESLVQKCKPAVVYIQARNKKEAPGVFSQGTGFNVASTGLVVTNRHVVNEAMSVEVAFDQKKRFFSRDITFIENYDLAIIRLPGENLPYLPVLTEDMPQKGQSVTIIGNPLGFERISARGKIEGFFQDGDPGPLVFAISTIVESGSSGSPVLNEEGQVVGIIYATGTMTLEGEEEKCALALPATALKEELIRK